MDRCFWFGHQWANWVLGATGEHKLKDRVIGYLYLYSRTCDRCGLTKHRTERSGL